MKLIQLLLAAVLLLAAPYLFADKPDPNVPNPPLQVLEYNVDGNGWIAVHEQGTASVDIVDTEELDVNITNDELDVNITNPKLTVDVDNFPDPQNVTGEVDVNILPANAVERPNVSTEAGDSTTVTFPVIYATTIVLWDNSVTGGNDPEFHLTISYSGGTMYKYMYEDGLANLDLRSFTHPIPVDAVDMWCKNESENCTLSVSIIGYR